MSSKQETATPKWISSTTWLSPTAIVISCLNVNTIPQPLLTATKPRQLWFAMSAWHSYVETSWLLPKLMNLGCSYLQQLKNLLLKAFDHFPLKFINWTVTRDDGISLNRQLNQRHNISLENNTYCWSGALNKGVRNEEGERESGKVEGRKHNPGAIKPTKFRNVFQCDNGLVTQTPPPFNPWPSCHMFSLGWQMSIDSWQHHWSNDMLSCVMSGNKET